MTDTINNIHQASAATVLLPQELEVLLSSGASQSVKRLNWLQFEALWGELAGLLAPLLQGGSAPSLEQLATQLHSAPSFVLRLCSLCSGCKESKLALLPCDDVLSLAAAALELNFVQGAGIRSFFAVLGQLA